MENLSVKTKILLLAGIMLVITCIVAGVGVFANQKAKLSLDGMYNYNLMTTQYLNDANNQLRGIDVDVSYILQQDFTTDNRKVLLVDISGKLKAISRPRVRASMAATLLWLQTRSVNWLSSRMTRRRKSRNSRAVSQARCRTFPKVLLGC